MRGRQREIVGDVALSVTRRAARSVRFSLIAIAFLLVVVVVAAVALPPLQPLSLIHI